MKAKVTCVKILNSGTECSPVIVMKTKEDTFVLLSFEERMELYRQLDFKVEDNSRSRFPTNLIRSHAVNAETGIFEPENRGGYWVSGENLWVNTTFAQRALTVLEKWQLEHKKIEGCIHAPNWLTITAVRKLAIAAGLKDINPETLV